MRSSVKPGDVIRVNETDYLYGIGVLHLRVTKVGTIQRLANNDWVDLEGLTLHSDGTEATNRVRHAVVRVSALRNGIQRPGATS